MRQELLCRMPCARMCPLNLRRSQFSRPSSKAGWYSSLLAPRFKSEGACVMNSEQKPDNHRTSMLHSDFKALLLEGSVDPVTQF